MPGNRIPWWRVLAEMCGLTGIYHYNDTEHGVDEAVLRAATSVVSYRGPDDSGYFVAGPLGLGHRRLSIIDLSTGDQPIRDERGNTLIFNGEIYNYIELRDVLRTLGHTFKTESDTEVVLAAYRQWGIDCQKHLNGMWAFAIWDPKERALFLSRDRIGEKPLYYSTHGDRFVFGSEIKCLLEAGVPSDADLSFLEVYLCLSYVPAPHTFFKHVRSLLPGHCLVVRPGEIREEQYWDLPELDEDAMRQDRGAIHEEFTSLLTDSVRIRMRSDVPFGAFLSGGLDSSCVVALMSEISAHPVETFTIGFDDKDFDERPLAQQVADKFGANHHEATVQPDSFEESLARVVHHYDDPFGDSSAIPTGYVSAYARKHVKMVLTGDGGDEVLSGYTMYQGEKFTGRYQKLPAFMQKAIPAALTGPAALLRGSMRYKMNRAIKVTRASSLDFESRLIAKIAWGNEALVKEIVSPVARDLVPIEDFVSELMRPCTYRDPFYRLMYYNLKNSLPNDMLVKVDRMSMAHSLETRVPFLDHRLIELMAGVHKDIKMEGYERKSVLRNTIGKRLPPDLLKAPKKGFGVPLREWFKGRDFEQKLDRLRSWDGPVDGGALGRLIEETTTGRKDYGNLIWMLFVAERWLSPAE